MLVFEGVNGKTETFFKAFTQMAFFGQVSPDFRTCKICMFEADFAGKILEPDFVGKSLFSYIYQM